MTSTTATPSMNFPSRDDTRIYYSAPNKASMCYKDEYPEWEKNANKKMRVFTTTSTLADAFDEDDTFAYEPTNTCAIILSKIIIK